MPNAPPLPIHPRCRCAVVDRGGETFRILESVLSGVNVCKWCHNETAGILCIKCRALYEMRRRDDH